MNRKYAQVPSCTARISIRVSPLPSKLPPWLVISENGWMLRQTRSEVSPSSSGASALLMRWTCRSIDREAIGRRRCIEAPVIATAAATTSGLACRVGLRGFERRTLAPGRRPAVGSR